MALFSQLEEIGLFQVLSFLISGVLVLNDLLGNPINGAKELNYSYRVGMVNPRLVYNDPHDGHRRCHGPSMSSYPRLKS